MLFYEVIKMSKAKKDEKNSTDKNSGNNDTKEELTSYGDKLWKLPEDDDVDVDEVYERPIIPGTSGVET